ncbi:MAG: TonB-dependent receptor plug domain-containing protein [Bacteroidota bacterium]
MKNTLYSFCTFIILLASIGVSGQTLTGKVVDSGNTPLPDVYISKLDGSIHAHTNETGIFYCTGVNSGDTMRIDYLGFQSKQIIISEKDFDKTLVIRLTEALFDLGQVVISDDVRAINQVSKIDLKTDPVNSSQEVLRKVPGLFIGQHAGGGKAEQIFLRGFDIDHGTDVSITVDGMPVNMVSHAHGQGYADLHFLIPETVEKIDFGKGTYYADHGNFTTAGYVAFETKEKLDESSIALEYGQFNTLRTVGLFDLLSNNENANAYVAGEFVLSDGPTESPQNFNRVNIMGKYTGQLGNNDKVSILASHFQSKWDASGQIPQRAVDSGLISRFGSIDDTEGGNTRRTNLAVSHTKMLSESAFVKSRAYYSFYQFELFSNFTFFLDDPVNGDQIRQFEKRNMFGLESVVNKSYNPSFADEVLLKAGVGFRHDAVRDNTLSRTFDRRTTLDSLAFGNVDESNYYLFFDAEIDLGKVLINPGVRLDYFKFDYNDFLVQPYATLSEDRIFAGPKLNILYNPSSDWQLFFKSGIGFHSNDTRVVVAQSGEEILPAALGAETGVIWKPISRLWINTALWYLFLQQEFVYVGDAAVVEPSGQTKRMGIDFGLRAQPADWLFFDLDLNYTHARAIGEPEGEAFIPLAPDFTAIAGLSVNHPSGFSGSLKGRYLKDRPANEDNSIVAEGYFVTDLSLNYSRGSVDFGITVENLFDTDWNEAQFATESRLFNETEPTEEIHFTPGVPFFIKGKLGFRF